MVIIIINLLIFYFEFFINHKLIPYLCFVMLCEKDASIFPTYTCTHCMSVIVLMVIKNIFAY